LQVIIEGGGRSVADRTGRTPAGLADEHGKMKVQEILEKLVQ